MEPRFENHDSVLDDLDLDPNDQLTDEASWDDWSSDNFFDLPTESDPFTLGSDDDVPTLEPLPLPEIVGDPAADMEHWHQQSTDFTCAVVSQEFILDSLTGEDFTEAQLMQEAMDHGWLDENGTPLNDVGNILELHHIPVERRFDASMDDLIEQLNSGEKVIVAVDSGEIWNPSITEMVEDFTGIPGSGADHAVQVIGVDNSDLNNPTVILNDPGSPNGQGLRVPLDRFQSAWEDSGSYMVSTDLNGDASSFAPPPLPDMSVGGYYNADGTYHYTSDNTDRDPETGAIVRRW